MSVSFGNPLSDEGKTFLYENLGEPVAADDKVFLFDKLPEIESSKLDDLAALAGQLPVVTEHSIDDVVTLGDDTRYIATSCGWEKILDAGETRVAAEAGAEESGDGLSSGEGAGAGADGDEPGGIHGGPDDGSAKPAADDIIDEGATVDDGKDVASHSADGLPLWLCHKTVAAFKIRHMNAMSNGQARLIGEDPEHDIVVDAAYIDKYRPQIGGYFVRYHDGYRSWSPAEAFEDSYEPNAA